MGYFGRNKYKNIKVTSGGNTYDSRAEAMRGRELELLQAAGEIEKLQRQVKFVLIPAQYELLDAVYTKGKNKGQKKRGKLIEHEVAYYADFVYINANGEKIVEDVKGVRTKEYILKRKMLLYFFGIRVHEIRGRTK